MNGMILYPTDDEIVMLRATVNCGSEKAKEITENNIILAMIGCILAGVTFEDVFGYKPLKINETVLG